MPVEIVISAGLAIGTTLLFREIAERIATFRENLASIRRAIRNSGRTARGILFLAIRTGAMRDAPSSTIGRRTERLPHCARRYRSAPIWSRTCGYLPAIYHVP